MRISRGLPFNACMNARACTSVRSAFGTPTNLTHNHELYQGAAPPGLTYLTYRWRVKQGEEENEAQTKTSLCIGVCVPISATKRVVVLQKQLSRLPRIAGQGRTGSPP